MKDPRGLSLARVRKVFTETLDDADRYCRAGSSSGRDPRGREEVILHLNFEEIRALRSGGRSLLGGEPYASSSVLAPPEERALLQAFLPRLDGDISLSTLAEVRGALGAVHAIIEHLLAELRTAVLATHAADEVAVAAYFDYAHALVVGDRLEEMTGEMEAVIELVTGARADAEVSRTFRFPD